MLKRFLIIAVPLSVMFGARAYAQANDVTRNFAPWMTLEDDEPDAATVPEPHTPPQHSAKPIGQPSLSDMNTPAAPVMTPRDTARIVAALYDDHGRSSIVPSPLEQEYSKRASEPLVQFGYDQFTASAAKNAVKGTPAGGVQDDFVLGNGDRVRVTFRGQRQDSKVYNVGSNGQLVIDDLPPVSAAGRSVKQVRDELQALVNVQHNTTAYLSLEEVQQIGVLVTGHVAKPGPQSLTVFNTTFDALTAAGGIDKTGSLRRITLVRGGTVSVIDLYGLLTKPDAKGDYRLQDGDRLIVPTIGPTMAVGGGVKRPGIYELPVRTAVKRDVALAYGGGALLPGANRLIAIAVRDGRDVVADVTDDKTASFGDGSILLVNSGSPAPSGEAKLSGETRKPGPYQLGRAGNLSALLNSETALGPDVYPLIGVIKRRDADEVAPAMIAFTPLAVLHGQADAALEENDVVYLFSRAQMEALQKDESEIDDRDKADGQPKKMPDDRVSENSVTDDNAAAPPALDRDTESFLRERCAFVRGAVRDEGCWPVGGGVTLDNVFAAAGGMTYEASTGNIEVQSRLAGEGHQTDGRSGQRRLVVDYSSMDPAAVMIGPGDSVRVRQKFQRTKDRSVLIEGEVANPGRYDLMADDHLSALLMRAGGLTPEAYAPGTIFSRESERKAEEMRFRSEAQELEAGLAAALHGEKKKDDDAAVSESQIDMARDLIDELRHARAVGRITVEADPDMLGAHPDEDILLEGGDRIYIPRRPLTVRVAGEVESPAALAFRKEKGAEDYIKESGGYTYNADDDRAFVVFPDGSARPLAVSSWNHSANMIPPGSTIIVPRDPKPFDFIQTAKDVTQILSNLAITGIFIHDLNNGSGY